MSSIYTIAVIFYECSYNGGEVTISDEHQGYDWLTEAELREPGRTFVSDDEREQLFAYLASRS